MARLARLVVTGLPHFSESLCLDRLSEAMLELY